MLALYGVMGGVVRRISWPCHGYECESLSTRGPKNFGLSMPLQPLHVGLFDTLLAVCCKWCAPADICSHVYSDVLPLDYNTCIAPIVQGTRLWWQSRPGYEEPSPCTSSLLLCVPCINADDEKLGFAV